MTNHDAHLALIEAAQAKRDRDAAHARTLAAVHAGRRALAARRASNRRAALSFAPISALVLALVARVGGGA